MEKENLIDLTEDRRNRKPAYRKYTSLCISIVTLHVVSLNLLSTEMLRLDKDTKSGNRYLKETQLTRGGE